MLACLLARELRIRSIVIPPHAGAFSAAGLLSQDLTRKASLTAISPLDAGGVANADACLARLFVRLMPEGGSDSAGRLTCSLDCRYVGQEYTLTVDVPSLDGKILEDAPTIQALFEDAHRNAFGYELDDAVEIVTVRATLRQELGKFAGGMPAPIEDAQVDPTSVEAWSFKSGRYERFAVVDRGSIASGAEVEGPALVLEPTATTYVDRGSHLRATPGGELVISLEPQDGHAAK